MKQDILTEFRHAGLLSGDKWLFPLNVARGVVQRCRERSIGVMGFEGFVYDVKKRIIVPRLDLILHVDFRALHSWEEVVKYCADSAETTLSGVEDPRNLYFLFMLLCEEEWKARAKRPDGRKA